MFLPLPLSLSSNIVIVYVVVVAVVIPKKGGEQEGHSIAEQSDEMGNLLWDLDLVVSPTAPNSINLSMYIIIHVSYILYYMNIKYYIYNIII